MASSVEKPNQTTPQLEPLPPSQHHQHHHHHQNNQISFGMMQASSSTSLPGNFINKDSAYDLGELDQALFLYLNGQTDTSSIQDQKQNSTSGMRPPTLNIFPSEPMHVEPSSSNSKANMELVSSETSGSRKTNLPKQVFSGSEPSKTVKQLFVESIQNGTMEGFYRLISYFQTQSEPAYCGLASLAMVLNALAIDPGRKWKGPWRWFDESMLDCCEPLEIVKARGITFGKLVCLAHCAGAKVDAYHASQSNINEFRKYVLKCSTSDDCHLISSYHRGALKQTGTGHFSPIGGYHVRKDMALILDVARFKYPPHWVPLTMLWEGMNYTDESTGKSRGFMLISRPHTEPGMLYTLSCKHESWNSIAKFLMDDVPLLLKSEDVEDIYKVLSIIFTSLPSNFEEFIKWIAEVRRHEDGDSSLSEEEKTRLTVKEEVLRHVHETRLFKHVSSFLSSSCGRQTLTSGDGDALPSITASVCCQGAEILGGKLSSTAVYCCPETCMKCWKAEDDKSITMVSGTVVNGNTEQGVDVLIPSSSGKLCCTCSSKKNIRMHPASSDVLTVLILSLPSTTWDGITDEKLLKEIHDLVSHENLSTLLQEEVLHLRRQLHILKRCQEGKVDEDLDAPSS